MDLSQHIPLLCTLSRDAGKVLMQYFQTNLVVEHKHDNSPVTLADKAASDFIVKALTALTPEIPVISEEDEVSLGYYDFSYKPFWLVDPLDGTKGFIKGTGEFTVNIALIENGIPTLGFVYIPVDKLLYFTQNGKAWRKLDNHPAEVISVRHPLEEGLSVVASKSHLDTETKQYLERLKVSEFTSAASSLKFCRVAEGKADIYPRFGPTMEWDTAAAHAVLLAAGGSLTRPDGTPFRYGKTTTTPPFLNGAFIARGAV